MLHIKVLCNLANNTKAEIAEIATAPIVVRGRSPRNFQSRKEIPLVGSSAASRGQALVENGMGIAASSVSFGKDGKGKGLSFDLPRSSFTFTGPSKVPDSPVSMRSK